MIIIRKSNDRGLTEIDWLKSYHTFSFGNYYDPKHMHFGDLRVINEDRVQPGQGFGKHAHEDMDIISYVVEGALEHKDSMGTGSVIKPGDIQRMSAGTGVTHSEFNHSKKDIVHFLQIWIIPNKSNINPSYEQKVIPRTTLNHLHLIGSPNGGENAITIHQNVNLYAAYLSENSAVKHELRNGHKAWLQLIKGAIKVNDQTLSEGDGAAITDEKTIQVESAKNAEFLLFDLW